jgi:diguanylate cyclase (GGDEF)-like protein
MPFSQTSPIGFGDSSEPTQRSPARLGGDEFAILIPHVIDVSDVSKIADRLINCLRQPIQVGDLLLEIQASIGIDITTADRTDSQLMQRNADAAMYMAKGAGKAQYATYDPELDNHLHRSQGHDLAG